MRLLVLIIFLLLIGCGNGPAEDRGKQNCKNDLLVVLLLLKNNDNGGKSLAIGKLNSSCKNNDSLINRYYRGYVLNKE